MLNLSRANLVALFANPEATAGTFVRFASDEALGEVAATVMADENLASEIRRTIILAIEDYIYEQEGK